MVYDFAICLHGSPKVWHLIHNVRICIVLAKNFIHSKPFFTMDLRKRFHTESLVRSRISYGCPSRSDNRVFSLDFLFVVICYSYSNVKFSYIVSRRLIFHDTFISGCDKKDRITWNIWTEGL